MEVEDKLKRMEAYGCNAQKYLKDLDDLRTQLTVTKSTAESTHRKVSSLRKDVTDENNMINKQDDHVKELEEKLDKMQKHLKERELLQKQLKDNVLRVEHDIMEAMEKSREKNDCELKKILDEVSPKNIDNMNRLLSAADVEISKLRNEIMILSSHWKVKTKELQTQVDKHQKADQELKTRVLKLEFCFRNIRSQAKKFHRMDERRDKAIEELRDKLGTMQHQSATASGENQNFWGSSHFKFLASSLSLLILVTISK